MPPTQMLKSEKNTKFIYSVTKHLITTLTSYSSRKYPLHDKGLSMHRAVIEILIFVPSAG